MEKGSSSSSSSSVNSLKFGKKIYFEGGLQPEEEEAAPPPPSPAKKGRTGVVQGGQPPRCQVEGCMIDLSDSKAYYCRHKVCGFHSKSPMVIVAGLEQRFCQQCSRFHLLPEFDQGKRSCRRRLAGHNERRRKPPPGPLLPSRYASLSPLFDDHGKTGGLETELGAYSAFSGRDSYSWPNTSKRGLSDQATSTVSFQLPWQISSQASPPCLQQGSTTRSSYAAAEACLSGISDSSSALSLLSNEPWGSRSQALDLGVNNFLATNATAITGQPSVNSGAPVGRYSCLPWEFKGDQDDNSRNMPNDMGLAQISRSHPTNSPHSRDLWSARLGDGRRHELEPSRGYDPSNLHTNWSL